MRFDESIAERTTVHVRTGRTQKRMKANATTHVSDSAENESNGAGRGKAAITLFDVRLCMHSEIYLLFHFSFLCTMIFFWGESCVMNEHNIFSWFSSMLLYLSLSLHIFWPFFF